MAHFSHPKDLTNDKYQQHKAELLLQLEENQKEVFDILTSTFEPYSDTFAIEDLKKSTKEIDKEIFDRIDKEFYLFLCRKDGERDMIAREEMLKQQKEELDSNRDKIISQQLQLEETNNRLKSALEELESKNTQLSHHAEEVVAQKESLQVIVKELKTQQELLVEQNSIQEAIGSAISHDLVSPIANAIMLLNILLEQFNNLSPKELETHIGTVKNGLSNLYSIGTQLIDLTKGSKIKPSSQSVATIISSAIQNVELGYSEQIQEKNISIKNTITDKNLKAYCDSIFTQSVVRNYLANAVKFSKENTTITLSARTANNIMYISVADKGEGMDQASLKRLLDPEDKFTTSNKGGKLGNGMGFNLVRKFVEKQGGNVDVKSELGEGTTVTFSLPIK